MQDFSARKMLHFEKWIHFLILWIVWKNKTSLPSEGPSPPGPPAGRVIAFQWMGRPPPLEKIPSMPLPPVGTRSFSTRNYKWIWNLFLKILKKLKFYWNFKLIFNEKLIKKIGALPHTPAGLCPWTPVGGLQAPLQPAAGAHSETLPFDSAEPKSWSRQWICMLIILWSFSRPLGFQGNCKN